MLLKKKRNKSILWSLLLVGGWWYYAFTPSPKSDYFEIPQNFQQNVQYRELLTPIDREQLKHALDGNSTLMADLIVQWDLDAELLEQQGYSHIQRLPRELYLRSQLLHRQIKQISPQESNATYLPQTYLATSFLLALTKPPQITAVPNGIRTLTQIFPKTQTDQIPFEIDRYNAEKLYLHRPKIAFTAEFAHPIWKTIFNQLQIPFYVIKVPKTPEEIAPTLKKIGQLINKPLESELLAHFIEAAFFAIDNQLWAIQETWKKEGKSPKILFAQYHNQLLLPTTRTMTGHLLKRSSLFPINDTDSSEWTIPIKFEKLMQLQPDYLIVSTTSEKYMHIREKYKFLKKTKLLFVDDVLHQFPSQYIVLAYFDLYHALQRTGTP